jgi:hypothetical protein
LATRDAKRDTAKEQSLATLPNYPTDLTHHDGGVTSTPMIRRRGHAFDVARSKGTIRSHEEPFIDSSVSHDAVIDREHINPAHGVVPVVVGEAVFEALSNSPRSARNSTRESWSVGTTRTSTME